MKKPRFAILNLFLGLGFLFTMGCYENASILSVNKDGSATLVVRNFMSPQIAGIVGGGADALLGALGGNLDPAGQPGGAAKPRTMADTFKEMAQASAGKMGPGIALEAFEEKTSTKGWSGFLAKYSIKDVNKLNLTLGDMDDGGAGAGLGRAGGGGPGNLGYTFKFTPGDVSSLKIISANKKAPPPKPAKPDEFDDLLGDIEAEDDAAAPAPAAGQNPLADAGNQLLGAMGPMMAGLRLSFLVQVDGEITESNSSYQSKKRKNVITVVDMPVDKMLGNPKAMQMLMNQGGAAQAEALTALGIPGVKMADSEKDITLKFK